MMTETKEHIKNKESVPEPADWCAAIRRERIRRGLSQHEFSAQIGIDQRNLMRIESGNNGHIPKSAFIYRLVAEHDFPLEMFFPPDAIIAAAERLA